MSENLNFLEGIIENDISNGLSERELKFRFPPEPNGYLHIGHVKAICINFGLGMKYNAPVNLRFDDTNPEKESQEYINSMKEDIDWLGFKWEKETYTSDNFEILFGWARKMIVDGFAYVDELSPNQISEYRKSPTEPGIESPFRNRPSFESVILFEKMKNGEFQKKQYCLRAKIDMNSPNMNLRDPIIYRISDKKHIRTGDVWKIYPTYDWAHGQCDFLEGITHSLCSLEFENHRPLYEWFLEKILGKKPEYPKQREFARLNVSFMLTSKRKLQKLVEQNIVSGWDDPRMPTIAGLRRKGYTPEILRNFIKRIGVAKRENLIDIKLLEFCAREYLNKIAKRFMVVQDPINLIIENFPDQLVETFNIENNPEDESMGRREVYFSRSLYMEREDFMEVADKNFYRLAIGQEVRLKSAYVINAHKVDKDEHGKIITVYATYDKSSRSNNQDQSTGRRVKSTIHWVSADHCIDVKLRLYDNLFSCENPSHIKDDVENYLNPNSLTVLNGYGEKLLSKVDSIENLQFQRIGYFKKDRDSTENCLIYNRTVTLKDSYKPQIP